MGVGVVKPNLPTYSIVLYLCLFVFLFLLCSNLDFIPFLSRLISCRLIPSFIIILFCFNPSTCLLLLHSPPLPQPKPISSSPSSKLTLFPPSPLTLTLPPNPQLLRSTFLLHHHPHSLSYSSSPTSPLLHPSLAPPVAQCPSMFGEPVSTRESTGEEDLGLHLFYTHLSVYLPCSNTPLISHLFIN